jgi:hypothetical protein
LKTWEDLARIVFEELDPELNQILLNDHDHPLLDAMLSYLWRIHQVFCDLDFAKAQEYENL